MLVVKVSARAITNFPRAVLHRDGRQVRVLRAFRLLRLLGSWGQLRRIVLAIVKSILPVIYSMVCEPGPQYPVGRHDRDLRQK